MLKRRRTVTLEHRSTHPRAVGLILLALTTSVGCRHCDCRGETSNGDKETKFEPIGGQSSSDGETAYRGSCTSDVFFVDVPANMRVPWETDAWRAQLAATLQTRARAAGDAWFRRSCPAGSSDIVVENSAVLKPRTVAAIPRRNDGHLRFHRFRFRCGSEAVEDSALRVKPSSICEVVETIRTTLARRFELPLEEYTPFFVGRECEAAGAGFESAPTGAMAEWHLAALGVAAASIPGAASADLFLLDGGTVDALVAPLKVKNNDAYVSDWRRAGRHRHGSAMAIYARQVAPDVQLYTPQVLDGAGIATGQDVAQALDDVLFEPAAFGTDKTRPLIVNLSLGWTSRLAERAGLSGRRVDGRACQAYEDPYGEAVRYLLALARTMDDVKDRPVFVVAAAGNTSGDPNGGPNADPNTAPYPVFTDAVLAPSVTPPQLTPACHGAQDPQDQWPPWFFPAQYDRKLTCEPGSVRVRIPGAFGVSAIKADLKPAANAITGAESPLVAVGQHVIAVPPGGAAMGQPAGCAAAAFPPPVRLPASLSGSSVSAAFVAAAAAYAQARLVDASQPPLSWDALARLLWISGRPVCRTTLDGAQVRRLDVGRLAHTIAACGPVVDCARGTMGNPISASSFNTENCPQALDSCGLERPQVTATCGASPFSPPKTEPTPKCPVDPPATPPPTSKSSCGAAPNPPCTLHKAFDSYLIGGSGPLPTGGGCPWCLFSVSPAPDSDEQMWSFEGVFELNPDFPPDSIFEAPQVRMVFRDDATGNTRLVTLDLAVDGLSEPDDWVPGNTVFVTGLVDFDEPFTPTSLEAELHTIVDSDKGDEKAVDVSPLIADLN